MAIEIDRSRILAYQACPRKRFLEYHVNGKGLQRKAKGLPLMFGAAFHQGAEHLLHGDIESAVNDARSYLSTAFAEKGVGLDGESNQSDAALTYAAEEQMALAEALTRGWGLAKLPAFLESFEVIEVEREGRANLTDDLCLMFRPDALVRDKLSGDLYVVSWKTCSTYNKRTMAQARVDMQSISEVWGLQAQEWERFHRGAVAMDPPSIEGVLYLHIVKGQRREDKWDSLYKQNTPLVYGWKKLGDDVDEWSHSFSYAKEDGSGESKLGKGWKKMPIWREYPGGVKQWITDLHNQQVFPRHINILDEVFPESLPVERRVDEVESWKRQVVEQELAVANKLAAVNFVGETGASIVNALDRNFPQYTHSCEAYSGCSFRDICWNGVAAEPGELYQIRSANHPEGEDEDE